MIIETVDDSLAPTTKTIVIDGSSMRLNEIASHIGGWRFNARAIEATKKQLIGIWLDLPDGKPRNHGPFKLVAAPGILASPNNVYVQSREVEFASAAANILRRDIIVASANRERPDPLWDNDHWQGAVDLIDDTDDPELRLNDAQHISEFAPPGAIVVLEEVFAAGLQINTIFSSGEVVQVVAGKNGSGERMNALGTHIMITQGTNNPLSALDELRMQGYLKNMDFSEAGHLGTISYQGQRWYLDLNPTPMYSGAEIWARTNPIKPSSSDRLFAKITFEKSTIAKATSVACKVKRELDDKKALVGCIAAGIGSGICIMGDLSTGGASAVVCTETLESTGFDAAWAACLDGLKDKIAVALLGEAETAATETQVAIARKDFLEAIADSFGLACADYEKAHQASPTVASSPNRSEHGHSHDGPDAAPMHGTHDSPPEHGTHDSPPEHGDRDNAPDTKGILK